jgi:hypothetical protein
LFAVVFNLSAQNIIQSSKPSDKYAETNGFIENKGQISDQNGKPNPDVRFLLSLPNLNIQLKVNGFSYDAYKIDNNPKTQPLKNNNIPENALEPISINFHRIDVEFMGANKSPEIIREEQAADYLNYYTSGTPLSGILQVNHYKRILFKNLYPGIDLEFYAGQGSDKPVEFNFIVHPGARISDIRWRYNGSPAVEQIDGKIQLQTIHGSLYESIPKSYEKETGNKVAINFNRYSDHIFGFEGINTSQYTIVIDPVPTLSWGTYFGGSSADAAQCISTDTSGNSYITGYTSSVSGIATSGAFQNTFSGGLYDGFMAKFGKNGNRLWSTYFGGTETDYGNSIVTGVAGNIYIVGSTTSSTGIATSGTYQPVYGGGGYYDAFIMKFSPSGSRIWGTYFGGNRHDVSNINSLATDLNSNVYLSGTTSSTGNQLSTTGAYKTNMSATDAYDGFIVKFNSSGARIWSSYYGGSDNDYGAGLLTDKDGNVLMAGHSRSVSGIATIGSYQAAIGGQCDAYLAKWSPSGNLLWATYYGGTYDDYGNSTSVDDSGYVILAGYTASTHSIATSGAFQTSLGGGYDAFLAKFSSGGSRLWATYFGGEKDDVAFESIADKNCNIYLTGKTASSNSIATTNSFSTKLKGGNDAFLAKFTHASNLQWGFYYGGNDDDGAYGIIQDKNNDLLMCGYTASVSGIADTGAYQPVYSGNTDAFIVRFQEISGYNNAGITRFVSPSAHICTGYHDVKVELVNTGLNPIDSVKVIWQIDGVVKDTINIKSTILSGTSQTVMLGNVYFPKDTLRTITAITFLPNGVTDTIFSNDTLILKQKPGLNGSYIIGSYLSNYYTFSEAVNDLNNFGICGAVEFYVQPGFYNESITLNQIHGSSAQNTLKFYGSGKYSTVLNYAGTSLSAMTTLKLNGTDYATFRDMTIENTGFIYGSALWLTDNAHNNQFINMLISVDSTSSSDHVNAIVCSGNDSIANMDGNSGNNNLFDSLDVIGGYNGITISGPNTTSNYASGNKVRYCKLSGQYANGIFTRNQTLLTLEHNILQSLRNKPSYGIYTDYCSNIDVNSNIINTNDYGIYLNFVNKYLVNSGFVSSIVNNMVSSSSGYALYCNQSSILKFWHNSFSSSPSVSVIRFINSTSTGLENNHIENRSSQTGTYILQSDNINTFLSFDYNNYYSNGGFILIGGSYIANLPILQASFSRFNQHSYNLDPLFSSVTDLHTSINLPGIYVGVDWDIEEDFRNTSAPVLGADEINVADNAGVSKLVSPIPAICAGNHNLTARIINFGTNVINSVKVSWQINGQMQPDTTINVPIAVKGFIDITLDTLAFKAGESKTVKIWTSQPNGVSDPLSNNDTLQRTLRTGLSGNYKIGGTKPDFADFTEAVSALTLYGVCGPVVINASAGTYSEQIIIEEIENASSVNTITFKGAGTSNTNLSYSGTSSSDWATLMLKGTDYVKFRDMTISSMGTTYGIAVVLTSKADRNSFINLSIQTSSLSTSENIAGIAVIADPTMMNGLTGQPGIGNVFDSLEIDGGNYGIYLSGTSSYNTIRNSFFANQASTGIYADNQIYLRIYNNSIETNKPNSLAAVSMTNVSNFKIFSNNISTVAQYGIFMQNNNTSGWDTNFNSLVYNNMVINTAGYSLYTDNSKYTGVLHNSFRSVGTTASVFASVYYKNSLNIDLRNNHIRNDNPYSYALYADVTTFDTFDYNNYYSFGSFVFFGNSHTNLAALKSAYSQYNQNSYSQNPQFISLTNLHTSTFLPGIYVGINEDFDGDPRCPYNLSVGADDDPDWGFAKPVIISSQTTYYQNYPVLFSNNIPGSQAKPVSYAWYIDGIYYADSSSIYYSFGKAGIHTVKFVAQNCALTDSTTLTIKADSAQPHIALLGNNPDTITIFTGYVEKGFVCKDFLGNDITNQVNTGSSLDTNVLGKYYVWYQVWDYWGNTDSVTRIVYVLDNVPPVISLIGDDTIVVEVFEHINDPGAVVTDNFDQVVTLHTDSGMVNKNVVGIYKMIYTSTDSSLNTGYAYRWVRVVDTILPVIKLLGDDTVWVDVYSQYYEAGAKVFDNYCTGMDWEVDIYPLTNDLATYTLTYNAKDCFGNEAIPVTRTVKVTDRQKPVINLNGFPYVTTKRWQSYIDEGVSIDDNFYPEDTLQSLLLITSNLDTLYPGIYNVCYQVTDPSGNRSVKVCRTVEVLESTDGIEKDENYMSVGIYPNPVKGLLTVEFGNMDIDDVSIQLIDHTGRIVYQDLSVSDKLVQINMEFLTPGMYLVKIRQGAAVSNRKISLVR